MIDLSNYTLEELTELKELVTKTIEAKAPKTEKVIYINDCKSESNYHHRKYKHWSKAVKHVNTDKANGFAFEGAFIDVIKESLVEKNGYVIEFCGGSLTLYKATGDKEKEKILHGSYSNMITFIKEVAEIVNEKKEG